MLGERFRCLALREPVPNIIHCGFPTIELSVEATRYGKERNIPVVLDVRDMWPDVFLQTLPRAARMFAKPMFHKYYTQAKQAFSDATAISGHAPGFCDYGLRMVPREKTATDRHFPFAYESMNMTQLQEQGALAFWSRHGIARDNRILTVCFFGTMGAHPNLDLETPIRAARLLDETGEQIRFVLCGIGPRLGRLKKIAAGLKNVIFAGWVDSAKIATLMKLSDIGLLPYQPSEDFVLSIPNKVPEYLSGGLLVLSSLTNGYLHDLLDDRNCGLFYPSKDPRQLARLLGALSRNRSSIQFMSRNAKELYEEQFRADKVYEAMADYLEDIVENHHRCILDGERRAAEAVTNGII
jgi:glycosyltransferase involved in cell wall biosynthesis